MFCVHDSRRFTVQGLGFKVQGSEYAGTLAVFCVRDSLSGFVLGSRFRIQSLGFGVED